MSSHSRSRSHYNRPTTSSPEIRYNPGQSPGAFSRSPKVRGIKQADTLLIQLLESEAPHSQDTFYRLL